MVPYQTVGCQEFFFGNFLELLLPAFRPETEGRPESGLSCLGDASYAGPVGEERAEGAHPRDRVIEKK
jgi:hypothetical protein